MAGACGPGAAPVFCWVVLVSASRSRERMAPVVITGRDSGLRYGAHQYSGAAVLGTIGGASTAWFPDSVAVSWRAMTAHSGIRRSAAGLMDRLSERAVLDRFVADVRAGQGQSLVVRGEPGVGKTVLLDYLAGRASGCLVARGAGVQSEMELAFAGLHQLCAPMLELADALPVPQREALRTALGLSAGPAPDRFLVGLAVLGLLTEAAGKPPRIWRVDGQLWFAGVGGRGLAAVRRAAEPVGLVFAARVPGREVAGVPELVVVGLLGRTATGQR